MNKVVYKIKTIEKAVYFVKFLEAAEKEGSFVKTPFTKKNSVWFTHHLTVMLSQMWMTGESIVEYEESLDNLIKQAVWFGLRGMGMKDEAIETHYNPEALEMMAKSAVSD